MCLVEVNTAINLVVACAMPILDKMCIYTLSKRVRLARENILEFLLLNHPLDCPICDQGGDVICKIYL
jgi:NADH-quinone oxidoreductase subunit G